MSSNGKILLAVLAGAAVGAVAAILYAPAKGEETRRRITDSAKKLTDGIRDVVTGELAETVENVGTDFRIRGNWYELKGKLKQMYANLTDNDLFYVEGKEEELLGRLQNKLGKKKQEIIDVLNRLQTQFQH